MSTFTDIATRDAVVAEFASDPQVDECRVDVSAHNGVIVLSGRLPSYRERWSAVCAAQRVRGVTVVADEIEVELTTSGQPDDVDIAEEIAGYIRTGTEIADTVTAEVFSGHVTLLGEVGFNYQREGAERALRHLSGVQHITNNITVAPGRPLLPDVERRVHDAMARIADIDARGIRVTADEDTIHLHGTVHSHAEKRAAELSAASAPGVSVVDNQILVTR